MVHFNKNCQEKKEKEKQPSPRRCVQSLLSYLSNHHQLFPTHLQRWGWKLHSKLCAVPASMCLFKNNKLCWKGPLKVSGVTGRADVSPSLCCFSNWLLVSLFLRLAPHVGSPIITLSFAEADLPTHSRVRRLLFCTFEGAECKKLFKANLLNTYIHTALYILLYPPLESKTMMCFCKIRNDSVQPAQANYCHRHR